MKTFTLVFEKLVPLFVTKGECATVSVPQHWVDCVETVHYSNMTLAEMAIWIENGGRPPGCDANWRLRALAIVSRDASQNSSDMPRMDELSRRAEKVICYLAKVGDMPAYTVLDRVRQILGGMP